MKTLSKANTSDFEGILKQEQAALKMYAYRLCRDNFEADDLVQETLLKALTYRTKFEEGTNMKAWLYIILKNTFINKYRRKKTRETFTDSTVNSYFIDLGAPVVENSGELKFIRQDLEDAIADLPMENRVPFLMNVEGYKYREIADEFGLPTGTVKTRIFVARRMLRNKLNSYASDYLRTV